MPSGSDHCPNPWQSQRGLGLRAETGIYSESGLHTHASQFGTIVAEFGFR